jgi:hypothetical protein
MFKMLRKSGLKSGLKSAKAAQQKAPIRAAVQRDRIMMPADGKPTAKTAAKPALSLARMQQKAASPLQRTTAARQAVKAAPKAVQKPAAQKAPIQRRGIASLLSKRRGF